METARARVTAATEAYHRAEGGPQLAYHVQVMEAPYIADVIGGAPRGLALLGLVLFAAVAGIIATRLVPKPGKPGVFVSTEEIARTLGIPVIAAIATGDGPVIAAGSPGRLLRIGVRTCELTLSCFGLAMLAALVTDSLARGLMFRSPLQAFALACERFLPL